MSENNMKRWVVPVSITISGEIEVFAEDDVEATHRAIDEYKKRNTDNRHHGLEYISVDLNFCDPQEIEEEE